MLTHAKIIRGTLVPVGRQPDGDSIRFRADRPVLFADIYRGHRIKPARTRAPARHQPSGPVPLKAPKANLAATNHKVASPHSRP